MIDQARAQSAVSALLEAVGEDTSREGLIGTPDRVARMLAELLAGKGQDPALLLNVSYEESVSELVVMRDIEFYSLCEHHLLPFFGSVNIAYLPAGRVVGASKLLRVVDTVSRRLQLQERLTNQISDAIDQGLNPQAVATMVDAEHLCMSMRGIRKPGTRMRTYATRGLFQESTTERAQVLQLLGSA